MTDFLQIFPSQKLGAIEIQATLEDVSLDTLQITEHPVEAGASITDHAYRRPSEVIIQCGWSNSSLTALTGAVAAFFSSGSLSIPDYIGGIYSQLLALQESRVPFEIFTLKRHYSNMLLTSLRVTTDPETSTLLMVSAHCREIIVVQTQATTLPPIANQSNPASTADIQNSGSRQPVQSTPSGNWVVTP